MASVSSQWWRGGLIYEIYPRSFRDWNGDGIGDLKGVAEQLDYVAALGADAIWLTPFYTSPMADFGYDVANYTEVDPIFGTIEDFDRVVARAHELGLKVMVDQVISHTSDRHAWFQESKASRTNPKADWYVWADRKADGTPPNNWLSVFGGPSWQWDTHRGQYYLHNFLVQQPDLNLHNPEAQEAVLGAMRFWLERGVDGFRLDAINFGMHDPSLADNPPAADPSMSEQPLSNPYAYQAHIHDKSRPELLPFLARIRKLLDAFGATTSLAEVGDGKDRSLQLMSDYAGGTDRLHMAYGFDFLGTKFTPAFVRETVERYEQLAGDAWPCWAFSNHDCIRHVSRWSPRPEDRPAVARLALALLLSLRGSVCLYEGEELGLPEAEIAFEDLQDPAGKAFWPEYKGRDGCRTPMPWNDAQPNAGFGSARPWLPVSPLHLPLSVARQEADAHSVLAFYRKAIAIRQASAVLRLGSIEVIEATGNLLALRRTHEDRSLVCLFNFGSEPLAPGRHGGKSALLSSGGDSAEQIEPFGFRWLEA